ncbi:hypothetical protein U8527_03150 [Kordia algicida OT-1]|uniref:Uncharacterized protein n=1 Tax=Kordia algicida OT-1 TaxID=391587 RepID=A9DNY6_9FLAO|nr:hypothetical protein [Kordia algicida]EDP97314.1 hypothetical protein KAOT1_19167 [Kordia algicida OT-1]
MRRKQKSIREKLNLDSIKTDTKPIVDKKEILKHPITKVIIVGVSIYGFLYVSKHFVNAYAGLVKAVRNAQHNLKR